MVLRVKSTGEIIETVFAPGMLAWIFENEVPVGKCVWRIGLSLSLAYEWIEYVAFKPENIENPQMPDDDPDDSSEDSELDQDPSEEEDEETSEVPIYDRKDYPFYRVGTEAFRTVRELLEHYYPDGIPEEYLSYIEEPTDPSEEEPEDLEENDNNNE